MRNLRIMAQEVANLTDARFFASWEVDWLGFSFDSSRPNYISPQKAAAIREWVEGPAITGVFGIGNQEDIAAVCAVMELDSIMVHIFTDPDSLSVLPVRIPVFVEIVADIGTDWRAIEAMMDQWGPHASFFVLNFSRNGISWADIRSDKPFPFHWLKDFCSRYPVLPSIALQPTELQEMVKELRLAGICLQGGEEEKTGFKSFEELEVLLETLEVL